MTQIQQLKQYLEKDGWENLDNEDNFQNALIDVLQTYYDVCNDCPCYFAEDGTCEKLNNSNRRCISRLVKYYKNQEIKNE